MRFIVIDPFLKTITEVESAGTLDDIYKLGGFDCLTTIGIGPGECAYLDDEGLFRGPEQRYFLFEGYPQPLAGRAVVCGFNEEGETVSTALALSDIKAVVQWGRPDLRFVDNDISHEDTPGMSVTRITPRFNK